MVTLTSFEEYVNILKSPYENNEIEISVGFFGLCNYQPQAWDEVFYSIRQYYPDAPIVLINDGMDQYDYREMAEKYNCILLVKDREICLHFPEIEGSYEFLKRTMESCKLCNTEWIVHLHPDVICQGKICYYPNAHLAGVGCGSTNGVSNNTWQEPNRMELHRVENYIRQKYPTIELNGWGWCGGSIMNIETFYTVYDSVFGENAFINLEELREKTWLNVTEHEDTMMPVLFALNGFIYRIWKDNPEYHRPGDKRGAFLHGYKEHYDLKSKGLSVQEHNIRCRTQNINKRLKQGLLDNQKYSNTDIDEKYL